MRRNVERMHNNSYPLRFPCGLRVICNYPADGEIRTQSGVVISQFYREKHFPTNMFAPYQVQLDNGQLIFVCEDIDKEIRTNNKHINAAASGIFQSKSNLVLIPFYFDEDGETRLDIWSYRSWSIINHRQSTLLTNLRKYSNHYKHIMNTKSFTHETSALARFKVDSPIIFKYGRCLWKRGTVARTNIFIKDGYGEITAFFFYEVRYGSRRVFICVDDDDYIVLDNSGSFSYEFEVGEHVYIKDPGGGNRWVSCRILMHAYPTHIEESFRTLVTNEVDDKHLAVDQALPPYAAYQVKFTDDQYYGDQYGFVCLDSKYLIRKHKPTQSEKPTQSDKLSIKSYEKQTIIIERWHSAYKWVINNYHLKWKIDRHNRMQTALNRVAARKRQIIRARARIQIALKSSIKESLTLPYSKSSNKNVQTTPTTPTTPTTLQLAKRQTNKEISFANQQKHEAALHEKEQRRIAEQIMRLSFVKISNAIQLG